MTHSFSRYMQLQSILDLAGLDQVPSELHGTVVGAIANHLKTGVSPDLLQLVVGAEATEENQYQQLKDVLYELYREVSDQLFAADEGFDLLLPDEEESLFARTEGLAIWCQGYLLGLLYNNLFSLDELEQSSAEIARDLMHIAEAVSGADAEKEEDWALAELQEYVKVGAQLIFENIYSERAAQAPETTQ